MRTPNPAHLVGFVMGLFISWALIDAALREPTATTRPAPVSQGLLQD